MIEFMGELRGLTRAEAKQRARRRGSSGSASAQWAKNKVQDLSKGMQQKVQFATALIHEPELRDPRRAVERPRSDQRRGAARGRRGDPRRAAAPCCSRRTRWSRPRRSATRCASSRAARRSSTASSRDIKRASAAEGVIALGFADDASQASAPQARSPIQRSSIERAAAAPGRARRLRGRCSPTA